MFSIVDELIRTRHELREVQEKLHRVRQYSRHRLHSLLFQLAFSSQARCYSLLDVSMPTISLYVQYNGFFNKLCEIRRTMTIRELLVSSREHQTDCFALFT
jgi:hypothetical protein